MKNRIEKERIPKCFCTVFFFPLRFELRDPVFLTVNLKETYCAHFQVHNYLLGERYNRIPSV